MFVSISELKKGAVDYNQNGVVDVEDVEIFNNMRQDIRQSAVTFVSMLVIVVLTVVLCTDLIPLERVKALESLFTTVYIALSSLVGAQMGLTTWLSRPK